MAKQKIKAYYGPGGSKFSAQENIALQSFARKHKLRIQEAHAIAGSHAAYSPSVLTATGSAFASDTALGLKRLRRSGITNLQGIFRDFQTTFEVTGKSLASQPAQRAVATTTATTKPTLGKRVAVDKTKQVRKIKPITHRETARVTPRKKPKTTMKKPTIPITPTRKATGTKTRKSKLRVL